MLNDLKNRNILILGGSGYLAGRFHEYFVNSILSKDRIKSLDDAVRIIRDSGANVVINCIGKTGGEKTVDACELDPWGTVFGNVVVPRYIAEACDLLNKKMVHISSGCIYQGDNYGNGFSEDDAPNFHGSLYSMTKILSESVLEDFPNILQLRIRLPIDEKPHSRNLIDKLLKYARSPDGKIVDIKNSITYIPDLLNVTKILISKNESGIFNVVNTGSISPVEILKIYSDITGENLVFTRINSDQLDCMTIAKRSHCIIKNNKVRLHVDSLRSVRDIVFVCINNYIKNI